MYLKNHIKIFTKKSDAVIESIKDLDKMITMHRKFFGNSINQNEELSKYYFLKAKLKIVFQELNIESIIYLE